MTDADLSKLRELLEKATPGPWETRHNLDWGSSMILGKHESRPVVADVLRAMGGVAHCDANLIVAAVNALPHLIAELTTAREALTQIERLGSDGEHSGDRHARCRDIARTALRSGEKDHG